jgi:hypothetical protein
LKIGSDEISKIRQIVTTKVNYDGEEVVMSRPIDQEY